jgi:hypothetical protein
MTEAAESPDNSNPLRRSWRDLDFRRLTLGLAAAPIPSIPIGYVVVSSARGMHLVVPDLASELLSLAFVALSAEIWTLSFGAIYLVTSPRRSGAITRANCLFLGGLGAVIYPPMVAGLTVAFTDTMVLAILALPIAILAGLSILPFGVLGGWIFWRIGVRPAKSWPHGIEHVFE